MAAPNDPLFGKRIPFLQLIAAERHHGVTRMHEGLYQWLSHYQQMMLLEAAIVGVVIPVLYSQEPTLIAPSYLRQSVQWFGVSLLTGVAIICISKWVSVAMMHALQQQFQAQDAAIGSAPDDEVAIAEAMREAGVAFMPKARLMVRVTWTGILGDLVFYGCFLAGLWYLLRGFLAAA